MRSIRLQRLVYPLALSLTAMGLLFGLVATDREEVSPARLVRALRYAAPALVALYVAAQLLQGALRAWRARLLIRHGSPDGSVPGAWQMFWVTLARNMFVDMLPARLGELSYVGMLNRGFRVGADVCLASLSVGLLFDFLALLLVLALAIPAAAQGASLLGSLLVLAVVCGVGTVGLFHVLPWGVGWARRVLPQRWQRVRPLAAVLQLAQATADSVGFVRRARILPSVLGLSAAIRAVKYAGLYCLFLAVTRPLWPELAQASPWVVLVALIAAEGAASLPVPTFMSFGTYEAGGLAALRVLGFPLADSVMAMLALHVLSQAVDYALGTLAYAVFSGCAPASAAAAARAPRPQRGGRRLLRAGLPLVLLLLAAAFAGLRFRGIRRLGALRPPSGGEPVQTSAAQGQAPLAFEGRIVWSSNRAGQHDLWMLTLPGATLRRLTDHPHTETYPRLSPDGLRVAFCRSREPWVSQRNPVPWDLFMLELDTGLETQVATNAFTPAWTPDGQGLVFVRNGDHVLRVSHSPGDRPAAPVVLAAAGREPFPAGVVFQTPDPGLGGRLALTLRGRRRMVALLDPDGTLHPGGGGCQIGWIPGAGDLLCVDDGARGGNAIHRQDPRTARRTLLFDAVGEFSHEYFPRISRDGRWLVYGASAGGHEHDTADYEIFLWELGTPMETTYRLTAHTGNDCWPDLWVP